MNKPWWEQAVWMQSDWKKAGTLSKRDAAWLKELEGTQMRYMTEEKEAELRALRRKRASYGPKGDPYQT